MPYKIIKRKGGYFVAKKSDTSKRFSKKPLTKTVATKQMTAILISESKSKK